jgi:8-oxo-dGTP diphosphatase
MDENGDFKENKMLGSVTERPISAAIIVAGGRVPMVRRAVGEGELLWQFPAGGIGLV